MDFVCDAPDGKTWFRLRTEGEAATESRLMTHAVEKHFRQFREAAIASYEPPATLPYIERDIGLKDHIFRVMPQFLTLRDAQGAALATAMLPPGTGRPDAPHTGRFRPIVVGPSNTDPFPSHGEAIAALATHLGITLDSSFCYPYRRE